MIIKPAQALPCPLKARVTGRDRGIAGGSQALRAEGARYPSPGRSPGSPSTLLLCGLKARAKVDPQNGQANPNALCQRAGENLIIILHKTPTESRIYP